MYFVRPLFIMDRFEEQGSGRRDAAGANSCGGDVCGNEIRHVIYL
jgi:hypothetical protein